MNDCHPQTAEPWEFISPTPEHGVYTIYGIQVQYMLIEVPTDEVVRLVISTPVAPLRQDFALRVTISEKPHGISIPWGRISYHSVGRMGLKLALADHQVEGLDDDAERIYRLAPGRYYLNVQNMENATSRWEIQFE